MKFKTRISVGNECYCTFSEGGIAVRMGLLLDVLGKNGVDMVTI